MMWTHTHLFLFFPTRISGLVYQQYRYTAMCNLCRWQFIKCAMRSAAGPQRTQHEITSHFAIKQRQ